MVLCEVKEWPSVLQYSLQIFWDFRFMQKTGGINSCMLNGLIPAYYNRKIHRMKREREKKKESNIYIV